MNVIGEVRGKRAIIVDDEIDTAGTLIEIVRALEREGVDRDLRLRHPRRAVRPGGRPDPRLEPARGRPDRHDPAAAAKRLTQITTLSIAPLIGEAIKRIHRGESVGALFSQRGRVHPGDAPVGGRRSTRTLDGATRTTDADGAGDDDPDDAAGRPARAASRATDEPAAPPTRRQGRPRAADRAGPRLARPAPLAALGRGAAAASCPR